MKGTNKPTDSETNRGKQNRILVYNRLIVLNQTCSTADQSIDLL